MNRIEALMNEAEVVLCKLSFELRTECDKKDWDAGVGCVSSTRRIGIALSELRAARRMYTQLKKG